MQSNSLSEAQLTSLAIPRLPRAIGASGVVAIGLEIPVGYRVVDIAVLEWPSQYFLAHGERVFDQMSSLSLEETAVLGLFYDRGRASVQLVRKRLSLSDRTKPQTIVDTLVSRGLLERSGKRSFSTTETLTGLPTLTTIEAKLVRWQEALDQARFNAAFSDRAYVLMPEECTLSNDALDEFRNAGIGLLLTNSDGEMRTGVPPGSVPSSLGAEGAMRRLRAFQAAFSRQRRQRQNVPGFRPGLAGWAFGV